MDKLVLLVTEDDVEATADLYGVVIDLGLRLQRVTDPRVAYAAVEKETPALAIVDLDGNTVEAIGSIAWLRTVRDMREVITDLLTRLQKGGKTHES